MTSAETITIPLNKSKLIIMLIGAIAFVGIGCWFVIDPPVIENPYWGNPAKLAIIGYASIVFFGMVTFVLIRKLPDTKPGMIIDDSGLHDNSGGLSAGHILWSDIEDISVIEIQRQKLIMIHVSNPEDYINRQKNLFKRKGMQMNHKMYGTPISITTGGLSTTFDNLLNILLTRFQKARNT